MASWFFDNLAVLEEFDRLLEDVEEAHSEKLDGHPESLTSIPWDIDFLSGAPDVYTDAPGLKNNSAILQDEPSSTKSASGDAKPLPGRSIVKSGNTSDVKYPHPFQTTSSDSFTKPTSNVKPLPGRSIVKSGDTSDGKFPHPFQTTSPDSVLQSRNTHSVVNCASLVSEIATVRRPRTKRSRIKRQRTESFKLAPDIPYKLAAKKSCIVSDVIEEPKDLSMGHLYERYIPTKQKKEKNILPLSNASEMKKIHIEQPYATRKCTHCETTSTPQWREGPQGPKTLCNACGVRHRTGRLFPEYRPAGSPTFVASLHSNSHKKVIELRNKTRQAGEYCCKNTPSYLVKDTHNGWHSNSAV